ncbi:hypothetical protein [Chromobacterium phragmitis]|uniref:hypothetical protein n=1 Tax=Chromobacterium phragmitis TaxID=2202141 RepID=UPI0018E0A98D|nr:hypothetical protein [Chromobacterium phragmitis]
MHQNLAVFIRYFRWLLDSMGNTIGNQFLQLSLQRALLREVHPDIRQVSGELDSDKHIVRLRFEYDGQPSPLAKESYSCAATEIIADFPEPWQLNEQHVSVPSPASLSALTLIAYRRQEHVHAAEQFIQADVNSRPGLIQTLAVKTWTY